MKNQLLNHFGVEINKKSLIWKLQYPLTSYKMIVYLPFNCIFMLLSALILQNAISKLSSCNMSVYLCICVCSCVFLFPLFSIFGKYLIASLPAETTNFTDNFSADKIFIFKLLNEFWDRKFLQLLFHKFSFVEINVKDRIKVLSNIESF